MIYKKDFKTHSVKFAQQKQFIEIKVLLNWDIFTSLSIKINSIDEERRLINKFVRNIFASNEFKIFDSSFAYYDFCIKNSLETKEQSWFNTIFIFGDLHSVKSNIELRSIAFQELYFSSDEIFDSSQIRYKSLSLDKEYLKENILRFRKLIEDNQISKLYHFTDKSNLKSIFEKGALYSWKFLKAKNQTTIYASNSLSKNLDLKQGLENYVRLSFNATHPMMHKAIYENRIKHPVIIEIDPSVIFFKKTLFSDRNATDNSKQIGDLFEDLNKVQFAIATKNNYFDLESKERSLFQAEVLVYEKISLDFFLNKKKLINMLST